LVKVPATKNSDGGYDVESGAPQEFDAAGGDDEAAVPGDDGFSSGDADDDDFDEDGGGKSSREASYDPDFDN
jgi:hypothetical protein